MKYRLLLLIFAFLSSCSNYGQLKLIRHLPKVLEEVSGVETVQGSNLVWVLTDNANTIYGLSKKGKIKKQLIVNAKNHNWEDLSSDDKGNLYVGDFGNNENKRQNLSILKIKGPALKNSKNAEVERIQFYFSNQTKFPPKKKQLYFDVESFFYFNQSFYLFTRSRVKGDYGKTSLYKIPAKTGKHPAIFIQSFNSCKALKCSITSADISPDKKSVVLLTHHSVLTFTDFENDHFFDGNLKELPLIHSSQKEGVCFKNSSTLYITDEKAHGEGGNLYESKFVLKTN